jgi:hypothetical protein
LDALDVLVARQRPRQVERIGVKYRLGDVCAKEAGHVDGMVNIVVNAAAKLSKVDTRPLGEFSTIV